MQTPGVVLGSFSTDRNAEFAQLDAERRLASMQGALKLYRIPSERGIRLVAVPTERMTGNGLGTTRQLLAALRQLGYSDAWYLNQVTVPQPVISSDANRSMAANAATVQPATSTAQAELSAQATQRQPAESPVRSATGSSVPGSVSVFGQEAGVDLHRLKIETVAHSEARISVDGRVDEAIWQSQPYFDNMRVSIPALGTLADMATQIRLLATEKGLYVSAEMEQPKDTLVRRLSRRDDFLARDQFGVTIDASGQAQVGYWFFVALGDSQQDGKVLPERRFQSDWDGPWLGKSAETDSGWSIEMFLPWSMMNMPEMAGTRTIGFAATRNLAHYNERYAWPGYPVNSSRFVSAMNQVMVDGVQPLAQRAIIPFAAATMDEVTGEVTQRIGADATWKPSPKLELTATLLPDFGAVEADDVVLNLTASETFFPEKRLFFLEGNEVFGVMPRMDASNIYRVTQNEDWATTSRRMFLNDFVPLPTSLINTRRIGGTANQMQVDDELDLELGQRDVPTGLLGAGKATGSIGSLRYGVLGAFEEEVEWRPRNAANEPVTATGVGRDFNVARLIYEDIGETRRSIGYLGTLTQGPVYDAAVHSIDAHYTNRGGSLNADLQLITSDVKEKLGYGAILDLYYASSSKVQHKFEFDYMDEQVDFNDLGFLIRNDYARTRYVMMFAEQAPSPSVTNFRMTISADQQYNLSKGQITDRGLYVRTSMVVPGRNTIKTAWGIMPSRYEDIDSRGNGSYRVDRRFWTQFALGTDANKVFSYSARLAALQEHRGDWSYTAAAGVTIRPVSNLSVDLDLAYRRRQGWLVYQGGRNFGSYDGDEWQPSLDVNWFIAPGHQLRWNLQWAGVQAAERGFFAVPEGDGDLIRAKRIKNNYDFNLGLLTTQLRYRWEIAPLTDFYLVYNLGNSISPLLVDDSGDLFNDSFKEPVIETFVAKLRYRFGN